MKTFNSGAFMRGFRAILPLWLGAAPFAVAYSIAAQKIGLSPLEIQWMSLTVSSAAVQMSIVQLLFAGASPLTILATAIAMSLHHLLYGLSLAKRMKMSRLEKATTAYFLTDAAYGLTVADRGNENAIFLWGAEMSMFLVWNLFTALGLLLGQLIFVPPSAHLDVVAPLTFFILLISAAIAYFCLLLELGSATIFIAGVGGAVIGALLLGVQRRRLAATPVRP
jgi:predicted branched-subunit amino acid permease